MRVYWGLKSIPELSGLDAEQRKRVWLRARSGVRSTWPTALGLTLAAVATGAGFAYLHLPGALAGAAFGGFLVLQIVARQTLPHIRLDMERRRASQ
ncbi:MAG: hypothetical protein HC882_08190 [Acidobacteria bacterium]|nr:hypothetical protein [Acidobacteriota bacterium]